MVNLSSADSAQRVVKVKQGKLYTIFILDISIPELFT